MTTGKKQLKKYGELPNLNKFYNIYISKTAKKVEFRYLISNNYKILYLINQKFIIIQKIYICKQNNQNKL